VIAGDSFFVSRSEQLAKLTLLYAMPTTFPYRAFAAAGGLMSYGGNQTKPFCLIGLYAEEPSNLPVHQDTKIEPITNLKTAKALGLAVPPTWLALADEVIE
jgi:putative tryptophan/tyrosine transport system substrate-binding protein